MWLDKIFGKNKKQMADEDFENQGNYGNFGKDIEKRPTKDGLKKILKEIAEETLTEVIYIKVKPVKALLPTDSKFGGIPYLPRGGSFPKSNTGRCLSFLAQINCADLPKNNIYPEQGILQFWIYDDDIFGADFDDLLSDKTKRVIYYPVIEDFLSREEIKDRIGVDVEDEESYSPFSKGAPFALTFSHSYEGMSPCDYRFEAIFLKKWNAMYPDYRAESIYDEMIPDEFGEYIYDENDSSGHKIGGYPFFTQTDPREYGNRNYNFLLLQVDSDSSADYEIIWGDVGVANFFATDQQMKTLNFKNVMYTWDCG